MPSLHRGAPSSLGSFRSGPPADPINEPQVVPDSIAELTVDATWEQVWAKPASAVWRITTRHGEHYLKKGPAGGLDGTEAEAARLTWLDGRSPIPAPTPRAHAVWDDVGWLLTDAVPGVPAHDVRHRHGSAVPLVEALGRGLRRWHDELSVSECPFDAGLDVLVESAKRRVAGGGVDPATMAPAYRRFTADQLLGHLLDMRPDEPGTDIVVAHGDPGLPNVLLGAGAHDVTGNVDLGRLGVSDRYRDLAIATRSLVANLGGEVAYLFFDAYGLPHPDPLRLDFYILLDDLW